MVIKDRKLVPIETAVRIFREAHSLQEAEEELRHLPVRNVNPPPPPGSISIGAASRKYNMPHATIWRWVDKGLVPVILRTTRYKYIDENALVKLLKRYKENPGQGKQTLRNKKPCED